MFWNSLMFLMFIVRNVHFSVKDWDLVITANVATSILLAADMQLVAGGSKAAI